jgi:hypothetical protein
MELEKIQKIEQSLEKIKNKTSRIYFLVQDTMGNPKASVKYIYDMALTLKNNGFNSIIIHETIDYKGVGEWLNDKYMELPHQSIDGQKLEVSPEDIIVIPEIYGHVMDQLKNVACGKIVLCQAYDHMLETMSPGVSWSNYGFFKCITTSEIQKKYISTIMKNISFNIVEPYVSECFTKKEKPSKPIISIHTRDHRDTGKIIKSFYLKYPQYRWITFRDMRGINQLEFAKLLKDSYVSIWVDSESAFGTFPLECMVTGTPVIGKVPNLKPDWMTEENGIWTYHFNEIIDILANYTQNWLEDNIADTLRTGMSTTSSLFTNKDSFDSKVITLFEDFFKLREENFSDQLKKINVTQEIN